MQDNSNNDAFFHFFSVIHTQRELIGRKGIIVMLQTLTDVGPLSIQSNYFISDKLISIYIV